jgi:exodeoxyribonuclease V beta subunit
LQLRRFEGQIDRSWGVASFSKLASGREADPRDEGLPVEHAPAPEDAVPLQGIHAFPRGMRAGTCLHEIIEQVEFSSLTNALPVEGDAPPRSRKLSESSPSLFEVTPERHPPAAVAAIVERKLRSYGIEGFAEAVLENVRNVAQLPLAGFTLSQTQPTSRIAELEFHFPVRELTTVKLAQVLGIERLQFQQISGFMNGFIDLVVEHEERFYLIDWKSNWLGPNRSAYGAAAVVEEMQRHFYNLQLCLYTVALHRCLQVRKRGYDYDQHFGGAFYIFLRGIDPAQPANGVHHQLLDRALVEKLSAIFE